MNKILMLAALAESGPGVILLAIRQSSSDCCLAQKSLVPAL